tara:strand:+ start:391 stop:717 length:327 start_codon:yes stop_codon:yes gene_type:complete
MARKYFLDQFGLRTQHFFEEPDGSATFETVQDVRPIIEDNKRQFNAYGDKLTMGKRRNEMLNPTHRVPVTVIERWMRENPDFWKDPKVRAKYLNDYENRMWRLAPTRI